MSKERKKHKTWNPLRVQDFKSLMHPYVFINTIVGLFPHKIESSEYTFSRIRFILSTIFIIVYVTCVVLAVYEFNSMGLQLDTSDKLHFNAIMLLGSTKIFLSYVVSRSKIRVLQSVSNLSRMLGPQIFRRMSKSIYINDIAKMTPLMCFISFVYQKKSLIYFICWYTFFMVLISNKLLVNSLLVLKACFEKINESLVELRETLITDQPHLLRRVYHAQRNSVLLRNLRSVKKQHLEVNRLLQLLSEVFGFDVIITTTLILFDVTFNVYKCTAKTLYDYTSEIWVLPFLFAVYYVLYLISITYVCESVRYQAKKSATNVHRILVTTFDEKLAAELELFSVQLYQQDNTFVAMGLEIDATLLTKVVSTIVTYLLILTQFLLEDQC